MKKTIRLFVLLLLCLILCSQDRMIVIPAIHVPAIHFDAIYIPSINIPAISTPYGEIPAVIIPAVSVPAFSLPAVDTTSSTIRVYDISLDDLSIYKSHLPSYVSSVIRYDRNPIDRRIERYISTTPWATKDLGDLFYSFGSQGLPALSWDEVEYFQRFIFNKYRYLVNNVALRPDVFLRQAGGDCEDWALLSCEFFRFWGWEAYVAAFFDEKSGHAICLVKADDSTPKAYYKFYIKNEHTIEGDSIPSGYYVPVDYCYVGAFSSALSAGMILEGIYSPAFLYGVEM